MRSRRYAPGRAWALALVWFAACWALAAASGTLGALRSQPLATAEQLDSPLWWGLWLTALLVILVGYGLIWPRGTFTDGRLRQPLWQLGFGLAWGSSQGLFFLTLWRAVAATGLGDFPVYCLAYLLIGGFNGLWHRLFWDIHVSPPHNYREWNGRKVLFCHTPNLIVSLAALAYAGNAALFVMLQTLALLLSAWAMRFPAWNADYTANAGEERSLRA